MASIADVTASLVCKWICGYTKFTPESHTYDTVATRHFRVIFSEIIGHWETYGCNLVCVFFSNFSLQWRHYGSHGVSNHQPHHCLLNRLVRRISKKTSKLRVTGLCAGNSPMTGEFLAQMASNAENVFIWWRHHVTNWYVEHRLWNWPERNPRPLWW